MATTFGFTPFGRPVGMIAAIAEEGWSDAGSRSVPVRISYLYRSRDDPVHIYACHCLNCQTRSGSAFAEHAMLSASRFELRGSTISNSYSTNAIDFQEVFCGSCHTRIYNRNSALPDMIFLRAGTLLNSHELEPIAHIWTRRKQPWLSIPDGVPCFEESPTPEQFGLVIRAAEHRGSKDPT